MLQTSSRGRIYKVSVSKPTGVCHWLLDLATVFPKYGSYKCVFSTGIRSSEAVIIMYSAVFFGRLRPRKLLRTSPNAAFYITQVESFPDQVCDIPILLKSHRKYDPLKTNTASIVKNVSAHLIDYASSRQARPLPPFGPHLVQQSFGHGLIHSLMLRSLSSSLSVHMGLHNHDSTRFPQAQSLDIHPLDYHSARLSHSSNVLDTPHSYPVERWLLTCPHPLARPCSPAVCEAQNVEGERERHNPLEDGSDVRHALEIGDRKHDRECEFD
jgi:hypothetical protein